MSRHGLGDAVEKWHPVVLPTSLARCDTGHHLGAELAHLPGME